MRRMSCARRCTVSSVSRPAAGSDSPSTSTTASTDSPTRSSPRSRSKRHTPHLEGTDMTTTTTPETAPLTRAGSDIDELVGVVTGTPRTWLRLEGLTLLIGALAGFATTGKAWWLVPALLLLPDVTALGLPLEHARRCTPLRPDARRTVAGGARWDRCLAASAARSGPRPDLAGPHRHGPGVELRTQVRRRRPPHPPWMARPSALRVRWEQAKRQDARLGRNPPA